MAVCKRVTPVLLFLSYVKSDRPEVKSSPEETISSLPVDQALAPTFSGQSFLEGLATLTDVDSADLNLYSKPIRRSTSFPEVVKAELPQGCEQHLLSAGSFGETWLVTKQINETTSQEVFKFFLDKSKYNYITWNDEDEYSKMIIGRALKECEKAQQIHNQADNKLIFADCLRNAVKEEQSSIQEQQPVYIILEYCGETNLQTYIDGQKYEKYGIRGYTTPTPGFLTQLIVQSLQALTFLAEVGTDKKGWMYGDFKPANIVFDAPRGDSVSPEYKFRFIDLDFAVDLGKTFPETIRGSAFFLPWCDACDPDQTSPYYCQAHDIYPLIVTVVMTVLGHFEAFSFLFPNRIFPNRIIQPKTQKQYDDLVTHLNSLSTNVEFEIKLFTAVGDLQQVFSILKKGLNPDRKTRPSAKQLLDEIQKCLPA